MFKLLILSLAVLAVTAEPVPEPKVRCNSPHNTLSQRYHESIAHAIHSMDLEALRMFNPNAGYSNGIPTVNMNLKSPMKVLPHAPHNPSGHNFSTHAMNLIDRVLSRVGVSDDGLGENWTPLERVVHNFHMKDLWHKIKPIHDSIAVDHSTCACLLNTNSSGVYPAVEWVARHYAKGTPITLLNRPIPVLKDAETWKLWRERLLHYYTPTSLRDAAYFLKCTHSF